MYYVEDMTQNAISEELGVGRVTVLRMLSDARALNEVKISLRRELEALPRLESALQQKYGVKQAIVAPLSTRDADPTFVIGAATGQYISQLLRADMKLGVGWGRTLHGALNYIDDVNVENLSVVSLLGGVSAVHHYNPAEFAWQLARLFRADCFLVAAPALVDSKETKDALVERCGIGQVFERARQLDAVILSVGGMTSASTTHRFDLYTEAERASLVAAGACGDILCQFYDTHGKLVDHPLNTRVMSVDIADLTRTPIRVLTSGGSDKVEALRGALHLLQPTVFITDEFSAEALLKS